MNVIKQIVDDTGTNTIKMIVRSNERGPQGEQGIPGEAATIEAGQAYSVPASQSPSVINTGTESAAKFDFYIPKGEKGEPGKDGSFQYKAGVGIDITDGTISLVGGGTGAGIWGLIAGNISDQTDLQTEFAKYTPTANLATVATSGSYNDLTNKPTIPEQVQANWTEADNTKADYIKNKPTLATVATSGSYTDLSNKPTIPTVNNAILTIQKNGTDVSTFTANASSNVTANITVPVITMQTTDPGEGAALAANNFIAVYSA